MATHYGVLGVSHHATPEEIKAAYRTLARRFHPDASETGDRERFKAVVTAYHTLSDETRREAYDRSLRVPETVPDLLRSDVGRSWLTRLVPSPPKAPKRGADQLLVCTLPMALWRDGGNFSHELLRQPIRIPPQLPIDQLWTTVVKAGAPGANGGDAGDLIICFFIEEKEQQE
jgi:DnaJ-class molecular chaperone